MKENIEGRKKNIVNKIKNKKENMERNICSRNILESEYGRNYHQNLSEEEKGKEKRI